MTEVGVRRSGEGAASNFCNLGEREMRFEYLEPESVKKAVSLLSKYGSQAKIIAGGTDLVGAMRKKNITPEYVIDISCIPGLDYISGDGRSGLSIGALTSIRALETSAELRQRYPLISYAASQLGSVPIRNIATIGGNLCNASPSAQMSPALIALSARVKIVGPNGERVTPLEDFFTGVGTTILKQAEMLVEIQVPVPLPNTTGVYLKHSLRGIIDLAIVNVAVALTLESEHEVCKDIKLVLGAVAPTTIRASKAEGILKGNKLEESTIREAARAAAEEAKPITDVRSTAEYRKEMVKVFTARLIREAMGKQT